MTSLHSNVEKDENNIEIKENTTVTTIQRIYKTPNNDDIIVRDPVNRRSFINKSAYAKLHRTLSAGNKRHSVDNLKGRYESLARQNSNTIETSPVKIIDEQPPLNKEKHTDSLKEEIHINKIDEQPPLKQEDNIDNLKEETHTNISQEEQTNSLNEKKYSKARQSNEEKSTNDFSEEKNSNNSNEKIEDEELAETQFTPETFGYPKTAKLVPPLIKPKPAVRRNQPKDVNSNLLKKNWYSDEVEEVAVVLRHTESVESVDKIAKELSSFTMDNKPKDRKRTNSFKKLFMGGLFGKDKKKKEDKTKYGDNTINNDNMTNETNFNRQTPQRQTVPQHQPNNFANPTLKDQEIHEEKIKELEQKYAELHVNRFNQIRKNFVEEKVEDYVPMDNGNNKSSISDYISVPVNKYIDTSSSASIESEKPNGLVSRDTPPRAQETYQNFKLVKPKASIPINSERSLPNPYQNEKTSPRTIERNLNKSNNKDYPDKANVQEDTYGSVFDSLEYTAARNGEIKPVNSRPPPLSPKSPLSLESSKLKLPSNREIYDLQPRVKSPIPINKVSTEKIIATELLRSTRSPTPPKRTVSKLSDETMAMKPPVSPKNLQLKPNDSVNQSQADKIVTNAMVHVPQRMQTPLGSRGSSFRASTPVDLRMSSELKVSPRKEDIRKSVEEYYWKELKKLKEEEDSKLHSLQMMNNYEDSARVRRSRSLSPLSHKSGKRNLSLPRDGRVPINYFDYSRIPPQQSIPEEQTLILDGQVNRQLMYEQNFYRNNPERRSVDNLQRPIFRRGSLTKQEIYENQPYNKRVSFSNNQVPQQAWPTRNGYTQSPPQRRLERIETDYDDEVFIQNPEPLYGVKYIPNEPVYSNRVLEQFRAQQNYENFRRQQQMVNNYGPRRLSMDSIPRRQDIYVNRPQYVSKPLPQPPPQDVYGRIQQYPNTPQMPLQRNSVYSSKQSITDSNYGQKQVTVRNKFCDMYGQIHDSPQSGVVMGQLQNTKMAPRQTYAQSENFVRGSRLTASANDVGKRYANSRYYNSSFDNRPLPPPPTKKSAKNIQISDTESGSDASEIQRIMQSKTKNKKRGFFGK